MGFLEESGRHVPFLLQNKQHLHPIILLPNRPHLTMWREDDLGRGTEKERETAVVDQRCETQTALVNVRAESERERGGYRKAKGTSCSLSSQEERVRGARATKWVGRYFGGLHSNRMEVGSLQVPRLALTTEANGSRSIVGHKVKPTAGRQQRNKVQLRLALFVGQLRLAKSLAKSRK